MATSLVMARAMSKAMARAKDRALHRMVALLIAGQIYQAIGMRPKRSPFWLKRLERFECDHGAHGRQCQKGLNHDGPHWWKEGPESCAWFD